MQSTRTPPVGPAPAVASDDPTGVFDVHLWRPSCRPERISLAEAPAIIAQSDSGVVVIDVSTTADPATLREVLAAGTGTSELTQAMVEDLLSPDAVPRVLSYADGHVESVSMVGAEAIASHPGGGGELGSMIFRPIEVLCGDGWLISCCQGGTAYPADRSTSHLQDGCDTTLACVEKRWCQGEYTTSGDLGVLLLHEVTCSFQRARNCLHEWIDTWERELFDRGDIDLSRESRALSQLRTIISEFRRRLMAMNVPQDDAQTAWFRTVSDETIAKRADRQIDDSIADLNELSASLRALFDLVHVKTAHRQQERSERLNRKLEFITVAFLVPTLVAGIFGANTAVPGESEAAQKAGTTWDGFIIMLVAMVVGAALVALLLWRVRIHEETGSWTRPKQT